MRLSMTLSIRQHHVTATTSLFLHCWTWGTLSVTEWLNYNPESLKGGKHCEQGSRWKVGNPDASSYADMRAVVLHFIRSWFVFHFSKDLFWEMFKQIFHNRLAPDAAMRYIGLLVREPKRWKWLNWLLTILSWSQVYVRTQCKQRRLVTPFRVKS